MKKSFKPCRLISVLLAALMLISVITAAPISVFAVQDEVLSIEYSHEGDIIYYENADGRFDKDNHNNDFFEYNLHFYNGDKLTVNYSDERGTVEYFFGWDEQLNRDVFRSGDEVLYAWDDVHIFHNQHTDVWSLGDNNRYYIEYGGKQCEVKATVIVNPVISIEYYHDGDIVYYENTDGDMQKDDKGNDFFEYRTRFYNGDKLTVTYSDERGTVEYLYEWDEQLDREVFKSGDEVLYAWDDVHIYHEQFQKAWSLGDDNYYYVDYCGKQYEVKASVIVNPIASIEYHHDGEIVYYENSDGSMQKDDQNSDFFEYAIHFYDGDILTVNYTDERGAVDYVFGRDEQLDRDVFRNGDDVLYAWDDVKIFHNQRQEHWSVGDNNRYYIEYFGMQYEVTASVRENPVKGIRFSTDRTITLYKETDGRWTTDDKNVEFFEYNVGWFENGDKLTVEYNDKPDTVFTFIRDESGERFVGENEEIINNNDIEYDSRQWDNHWYIDSQNFITVRYMGFEDYIPVYIVESPVSSIEYHHDGEIVYYENADGRFEKDNSDNDFFEYSIHFFEGDILTVNYTDERGKVDYTYGWDEQLNRDVFRSDDEVLYAWDDVHIYHEQRQEHWNVGDNNRYYIEYCGVQCEVTASVRENPVKGIRFSTDRTFILYKEYDGAWRTDDKNEEFFEYNVGWFENGDKLIVEYNNNPDTVFTFIRDESGERFVGENEEIINNYEVEFDSRQWDNHWYTNSENYITIRYMGFEDYLPVSIIESPVNSISCTLQNELAFYENTDGHWDIDRDGKEFFFYDIYTDRDNIKIIVDYNDDRGVVEYFMAHDEGTDTDYFTDANGSRDIFFDFNTEQHDKHWKAGNDNTIKVEYMGACCYINVTILHNYSSEIIPASCEEQGYTLHECTLCQDSYKDNFTDALGHTWDEGVITKKPSYDEEGIKTYTCTVCEKTREEAIAKLAKTKIDKFTVSGITSKTYTGKKITQSITVKNGSVKLTINKDYTIEYKDNTKAGTAKIYIYGIGAYSGTIKKTFTIAKAKNNPKIKTTAPIVKAASVKKAAQTVKNAIKITNNKGGKVTYSKLSGSSKYLSISSSGAIKVKKGTPVGKHTIKVQIKIAASANYNTYKKTATVKITVKTR